MDIGNLAEEWDRARRIEKAKEMSSWSKTVAGMSTLLESGRHGKNYISGCGDVDEKLLLDASNASVDEEANMKCEKRNDVCDETTGVTGNVCGSRKEQNNQTGLSFKLLG